MAFLQLLRRPGTCAFRHVRKRNPKGKNRLVGLMRIFSLGATYNFKSYYIEKTRGGRFRIIHAYVGKGLLRHVGSPTLLTFDKKSNAKKYIEFHYGKR